MHSFDLMTIIQILPAIIIGLTVHEFAHAYTAYLCGDYTAKDLWRISLNPLKHIDPLGFFMILLAGFGWAKPVMFNEYNLRNKESDVVKIALAWPLSNAVLAILFSLAFALITGTLSEADINAYGFFIEMLYYGIVINWGLFLFNLIPLPPLDGSHVFLNGCRNHPSYIALQRYGPIILLVILVLGSLSIVNLLPIGPFVNFLTDWSLRIFGY